MEVEEVEFLELGEDPATNNDSGDNSPDEDNQDTDKDKDKSQEDEGSQNPSNDEIDNPDEAEGDQPSDNTDTTDQPDPNDDPEGEQGEDEGDDPDHLLVDYASSSGVEFDDEELQEIEQMDESYEGLSQVADKVAEKRSEQKINALMEQNPHTARMLEYEMYGGDPEKYYDAYFPEQDYQEMEIQEDDVEQQKQVIAQSLAEQGLDEEDVKSELEDLENAGLLQRRAKRSLKVLRNKQEEKQAKIQEEREELREQQQEKAQQVYNQTVELVKEGEIEGIQIPSDKEDQFINYLYEPINEQGHTQAQLDSQDLGLEQRILMAYLNFSGYNLDDFINNKAKNSANRDLRKAMNKSEEKENLKSKGERSNESKPGKAEDIVSPFDI